MELIKVETVSGITSGQVQYLQQVIDDAMRHFGAAFYRMSAHAPTQRRIIELPKGKRHRPSRYRY